MLRDYFNNQYKTVDATFRAHADMVTGVAVQKADGITAFPEEATGDNLFFVDLAPVPYGELTAYTNLSDYQFENVKADQFVKLVKYYAGEEFLTNGAALDADADAGKVVVAGADGKLVVASGEATSRYQYLGDIDDNGHVLARIRVLDAPIANA